MRRGILLSSRRSATRCGQRGLAGLRLLASSSARGVHSLRRFAPVQGAATTFPSRSIPRAVHPRLLRSTVFAEPTAADFLEGKSATDRENPRMRASGHRPPDRSAISPTWRRIAFLPWASSSLRVPDAFGIRAPLWSRLFGRDAQRSSAPVLDFSSTIRSWVCGALPAQMCQTCPAASTCTELFNELRRRRPFSVL
jgi:hypothetical protein